MNYVFYLHAAAGTLDASTAPFVLTAATAKLEILIEFLFVWLALMPIAPAAGFDELCAFKFGWLAGAFIRRTPR